MSYVTIPLDNTPYSVQTFTVSLKGGAVNIDILLKLRYLDQYGFWLADIYDAGTEKPLVCGVPLVPGVNLLGQYAYLDIGEAYIEAATDTDLEQPDNKTLGSTFLLIWGDST